MKTFKIVGQDLSDGYHTFDELYEHRVCLFLALCSSLKEKVYYKLDYDEWFCIYLELDEGQISYHVPNKYKIYAEKNFKYSPDHEFDGHTSDQVLARLTEYTFLRGDK